MSATPKTSCRDVFYELVEAYRLMKPIERMSAWLFRVARNRIIDLFRKKRAEPLGAGPVALDEDGESLSLEELLPSPDAGPEAAYARSVLIGELEAALEELPEEQRQAFLAHEIAGQSFQELAQATGASVNALVLREALCRDPSARAPRSNLQGLSKNVRIPT